MVLNKGYLWSSWEKKWTYISGKRLYYAESKDTVVSSQSTSLHGLERHDPPHTINHFLI